MPWSCGLLINIDKQEHQDDRLKMQLYMVLMLFLVTAALGIPFLWMSRGFSTGMKIFLSIVVTLYTVLILYLFYLVMAWCYTRITDSIDFS